MIRISLFWLGLGLLVQPVTACVASFYGAESGTQTASGERFNPQAMTAASLTLPFGTRVRVSLGNRSVVVRINDRGPYVAGRCIDLSEGAARALGILNQGIASVDLEVLR